MMIDLTQLNQAQREAVTTVDGRLLILAGAGSGKTKVLTLRMAYLIEMLSCPPDAILGLTFTNKAASEMRARLAALIDARKAKKVQLSTFHSFCMYVLRKEAQHLGYTGEFTLYDRQDVLRLANSIARDILEHEGELPSIAKTLEVIALAKNKGLQAAEISGSGSKWHDSFTQEVAKRLSDSLRAYNACDFDHLLYLTAELFEKKPEVLKRYQERFRYVMIDEYQDTNPIQARIADLLTKRSNNLCVVGDDDQSIYSWRGADVANILRFDSAKVVKLEQNFRSTNTILKAANNMICKNATRHKKELWSNKGDGALIEVFFAPSEALEAEAVVSRLLKHKERHGFRFGDFAILYRSNALSRPLESALMRQSVLCEDKRYRSIPYQVYGGDDFYEHKEIKDLVAYLRVIANPLDHEAILRVINYPRRGVGEQALDIMTCRHRSENRPLWEVLQEVATDEQVSERAKNGVKHFIQLINSIKELLLQRSLSFALEQLIEKLNFKKAIFEEVKSDAMRKWKLENITEFIASMKDYEARTETSSLKDFLAGAMLDGDTSWKKDKHDEGDHVHLMTFHSAKGLEFPVCFLVGCEDHLIPHERSLKEGTLEEERRLMYVAMTRAKEHLSLSMATVRKRMGSDSPSLPSRFLFDIPKELFHTTRWDISN